MLKLPADVKIYLSLEPCDMRRQFDGLAALVRSGMERDPQSGDLYIFRNKRGDLLKILFFDRHGYCMLCKRLMRGAFRVALQSAQTGPLEISAHELAHLLSELSLERAASFAA